MRLQTVASAALFGLMAAATACAQQPAQLMGTVSTHDAQVAGGLEVQGENARLLNNASVTATGHAAAVHLARGGDVLVCSTSEFHLLHAGTGQALLFGLDRGALELHTRTDAHDVILTPDIRFTVEAASTRGVPDVFDLRLRVARNGDTCVDNAGSNSPVLLLNGAFGGSSYRLMPGQHVLFEHGNLREVVDHERSGCGCPQATPLTAAAGQHPFPEDVSAGLAAEAPMQNSTQPGEDGTQVSQTFIYGAGQPGAGPPPTGLPPAAASSDAAHPHGFFHAIGHFFHRLFHPGNEAPTP
jgi:hypothetical protein